MKSKITSSMKSVCFAGGFGRVSLPPCCQETWQSKNDCWTVTALGLMTLRDECQGNQHAGEFAHFASSVVLRDLAKGKIHEVRGEKKTEKERATEQ